MFELTRPQQAHAPTMIQNSNTVEFCSVRTAETFAHLCHFVRNAEVVHDSLQLVAERADLVLVNHDVFLHEMGRSASYYPC